MLRLPEDAIHEFRNSRRPSLGMENGQRFPLSDDEDVFMRVVLQPYQRIPAAARITGLSEYRLRRGCKDGTIPHIQSKGICYVDIPKLWDKLDAEQQDLN